MSSAIRLTAGAGVVALGLLLPGTPATAAPSHTVKITVMASSDIHGNALNWDYYKNAEYDDSAHNDVGLAKISTMVSKIRADRGADHTLLFDSGDTLQGTPLDYYYAKVEPITSTGEVHPMAKAMNAIGYDAVTLGNHEFNYGLPLLGAWVKQMKAPVLGANAVSAKTGLPAYQPFVIKTMKVKGEKPIKVGVLGLTNPGVAIWDKANVDGKLRFLDLVETAKKWVPVIRGLGATWSWSPPTPGTTACRRTAPTCRWRTPPPWSPSRCPASTPSCSATRTTTCRSASSPTRSPGSRCC